MNKSLQLPNEFVTLLLDKELTKPEIRILLFITRRTFGLNRKSDRISRREFSDNLGISFVTITSVTNNLVNAGLLKLLNKGNSKYSFSEWEIDFTNYPYKIKKLASVADRKKTNWSNATSKEGLSSKPYSTSKAFKTSID